VTLVLEAGFIAAAIPALMPARPTAAPATGTAADDRRFSREPARVRAERRREADVSA
jgi:hypothetical protein